MNPHRQRMLVASVPPDLPADRRDRLLAHVATADDCRNRIEAARAELARALSGRGSALEEALRLDALERVQEQVDARLTALVDELAASAPAPARATSYHDGVPA